MKKATQKGWAIRGDWGDDNPYLYLSICCTRIDAIREHVRNLDQELYDNRVWRGPLTKRERQIWAHYKRKGHSAVRVTMRED